MRFVFIVSSILVAGCQSFNQPITEASLPGYPNAGGQVRFPAQEQTLLPEDRAELADVEAPAEAVPAAEVKAPAAAKTECKRPTLVSVAAVGNPCETTRSFMQSKGMTPEQIKRVEDMSASAASH